VRLEGHHQALVGPATAGGGEHRFQLARVMAVVVDDAHLGATGGGHFAQIVEATADTGEAFQRARSRPVPRPAASPPQRRPAR
jgi:hypothetical protein